MSPQKGVAVWKAKRWRGNKTPHIHPLILPKWQTYLRLQCKTKGGFTGYRGEINQMSKSQNSTQNKEKKNTHRKPTEGVDCLETEIQLKIQPPYLTSQPGWSLAAEGDQHSCTQSLLISRETRDLDSKIWPDHNVVHKLTKQCHMMGQDV